MDLHLYTIDETLTSTISMLCTFGDGNQRNFLCYVLEDGHQDVKVPGKTRIPAGSYEIVKRYDGRHFESYKPKFGHTHTFMLKDVPNFQYIMMHIGNYVKDTEGCLLVGMGTSYEVGTDSHILTDSTGAYKRLYNFLTPIFASGSKVRINVYRS